MQRNIALLRYNPDLENFAFHRISEVKCLHFLNRLSEIAQFGYYIVFHFKDHVLPIEQQVLGIDSKYLVYSQLRPVSPISDQVYGL